MPDVIATVGDFSVEPMVVSPDKIRLIWQRLQKHKTLFSDLTRGNVGLFVREIMDSNTLWFEVRNRGVLVGLIWFEELGQVIDCVVHIVFFDRQPNEKVAVCRELMKWMFNNFPLQRITVTPPAIYYGTIRLLGVLGFTKEGCKRRAVLLGGKWNDVLIYGITREEVV